jgi:hypothetical protein
MGHNLRPTVTFRVQLSLSVIWFKGGCCPSFLAPGLCEFSLVVCNLIENQPQKHIYLSGCLDHLIHAPDYLAFASSLSLLNHKHVSHLK